MGVALMSHKPIYTRVGYVFERVYRQERLNRFLDIVKL